MRCKICDTKFKNNLGGQLTNHLKDQHAMSMRDYVIYTEYGDIEPKCQCGLCDLPPRFARGAFSRFAVGHQKFSFREKMWCQKFGEPACQAEECDARVKFCRGEPRQYCSTRCAGKTSGGFTQESTQQKIRDIVQERYGVDNVSKTDFVRKKIGEASSRAWKDGRVKMTDEWRAATGRGLKKKWQDPEFHARTSAAIAKALRDDPERFARLLASSNNGKLSKLHRRIRDTLRLKQAGFLSEQLVAGRYRADELHTEKCVIVEIHGDYVHANPNKFSANDIIRLPGQAYTAAEKWEMDAIRTKRLEDAGYKVIVIWESDSLEQKRKEIYEALK